MFCLDGKKLNSYCKRSPFIDEDIAVVHHYRNKLFKRTDIITREDKTMWKYKNDLIKAVAKTLKKTGFKP